VICVMLRLVVTREEEWGVGVGVGGGVGGTIRLWRTALFYGGSRSREYQVASRGWRV
jgi:hypothetical protein